MISSLIKRARKDGVLRVKLFLCLSFIFNALYSIFLYVVSRINGSRWFFVMSIYYGLLSIIRVFVFIRAKEQEKKSAKINTMYVCGWFLLLINLVVSTMMFILIYGNIYTKHHEITVITLATYTFSTLTVAIVNCAKYLKKTDYVYSCVKVISLISASVSIVTLTNTMLVTFGEEKVLLRGIILPILCGFVAIFIILTAILMIRKAKIDLRTLKDEEKRQ